MDRTMPQPENAIDLLKQDHRTVEDLFKKFEDAKDSRSKRSIANTICDELTVHAIVEEEIFYPAALGVLPDDKDLIWEATVEHGTLEGLIAVIRDDTDGGEIFDAHVKVLKEYVEHHVKEEENEMFPKVKRSELDMDALGKAMAERKQALADGATSRTRRAAPRKSATSKRSGTRPTAEKPAAPSRAKR